MHRRLSDVREHPTPRIVIIDLPISPASYCSIRSRALHTCSMISQTPSFKSGFRESRQSKRSAAVTKCVLCGSGGFVMTSSGVEVRRWTSRLVRSIQYISRKNRVQRQKKAHRHGLCGLVPCEEHLIPSQTKSFVCILVHERQLTTGPVRRPSPLRVPMFTSRNATVVRVS